MKSNGLWLSSLLLGMLLFTSCDNDDKRDTSAASPVNHPAINNLSEKISTNPDNPALYYERGNMLHQVQQDSLALLDFKKAISLDSTKAEYYSAIGDLLFEHKDISGSISWIEKAIKLNPSDPKAQLKVAKMHIYLQEYNKAFAVINTVLRQDVYNPEGYFLKGMVYKNMKDTAKAISSFQTAVDVQPAYKDAVVQLGMLHAAQKNPLALKYYENAFKLDTNDVSPLYNKGLYHQQMNNLEAAKEEYKKAIGHDKNYANAFFGMGWILIQQDSLEKAWRQFDIVTKIEPANPDAYYNRGLCSEMMGKKQEAVEDYKQVLNFEPDYKEATAALKRLGGK